MARTKVFDETQVLNRAMNLFWQRGYHATSAQDLVDGLGISRSSLYDTYGDKHSLFVKALRQYQKERIDDSIKDGQETGHPETYIRSLFEFAQAEALNDNRSRGCFLVNTAVELAPVDEEVAAIVNAIMHDFENAVCHAIEEGQKTGVFTSGHTARSLARFVFNSLNGLRVTVKFDASQAAFEDIVNVCLAALRG